MYRTLLRVLPGSAFLAPLSGRAPAMSSAFTTMLFMCRLLFGLPLVAGLAIGGPSPASAIVVTDTPVTPPFEVDWSCVLDTGCNGGNSNALTGVATFSNFAFNDSGTSLTFDIAISNTTAQQSFNTPDWQSIRLTSFGWDTIPETIAASETGAAVFTDVALATTFPNVAVASNTGLHPAGSGATPTVDNFLMTLSRTPNNCQAAYNINVNSCQSQFDPTACSGDPNCITLVNQEHSACISTAKLALSICMPSGNSVDFGTEFDVKFQTAFGSFEFQGAPCFSGTPGCGVNSPPPIAEPASLALLGSALFLFGWLYHYRRSGALLAA